jgi:hypothetical protein
MISACGSHPKQTSGACRTHTASLIPRGALRRDFTVVDHDDIIRPRPPPLVRCEKPSCRFRLQLSDGFPDVPPGLRSRRSSARQETVFQASGSARGRYPPFALAARKPRRACR